MRAFRRCFVAFLCLLQPFLAAEASRECMVPMSDGVKLVTTLHFPDSGTGPWPAILGRTPYPRGGTGEGWTDLGIVRVVQSVRGRFGSEGEFRPFADEGWGCHRDGADTVKWILDQPWCNGKVATYGGSAPGLTSALLAPSTGMLSCQVVQEACGDFSRFLVYQGGVFRKALVEGWLAAGVQFPEYANVWKAELPSSPYWKAYAADLRASEITSPGLLVGGWWDIFATGTIEHFLRRQFHGGVGARGNQKLVMRPAAHGPWGSQSLKFPPNFDEFRVTPYRKRFVQYWLCGVDNGIMKEPAVTYYTVGADTSFAGPGWEWRTAENWPPFSGDPVPKYLHPEGVLDPSVPECNVPLTFKYDPNDPVPSTGGQNLTIAYGPLDQRPVSSRADVLVFMTPPLQEPLETTGYFEARLYVSSDAPDTDFTAKLVDVYPPPDGREILMLDGITRLKYREGYEHPAAPLLAGQIVPVTVELGHISWVFGADHRIGLQISSSNYPRFEVNPNNGNEFPSDTTPSRVANNTVHLGKEHPSALMLPAQKKE